jgi:hypothetical protein
MGHDDRATAIGSSVPDDRQKEGRTGLHRSGPFPESESAQLSCVSVSGDPTGSAAVSDVIVSPTDGSDLVRRRRGVGMAAPSGLVDALRADERRGFGAEPVSSPSLRVATRGLRTFATETDFAAVVAVFATRVTRAVARFAAILRGVAAAARFVVRAVVAALVVRFAGLRVAVARVVRAALVVLAARAGVFLAVVALARVAATRVAGFRVVAGLRVVAARAVVARFAAGAAFARTVFFGAALTAGALRVVAFAADALVVRTEPPRVAAARVVFGAAFVVRVDLVAVREPGFGPGLAPLRTAGFGPGFAPVRAVVFVAALLPAFGPGFFAAVVARAVRVAVVRAVVPAVRRPPARTAIARVRRPSVFSSLFMVVPLVYADNG